MPFVGAIMGSSPLVYAKGLRCDIIYQAMGFLFQVLGRRGKLLNGFSEARQQLKYAMYRVMVKQANVICQPRRVMRPITVGSVNYFTRDVILRNTSHQYRRHGNVFLSKRRVIIRLNAYRMTITPMGVKFTQGEIYGRVRVGLLPTASK